MPSSETTTEKAPKTWKERRERKELRTSATQHETFDLCKRKWWLNKIRRLSDGGSTHAQALGTVLHSVCERYLLADDLGRDRETGEPVDLYPEGWEEAINRYGKSDGRVTPAEAALIKRLVAKAIEEGVLERRPNRSIEHAFRQSILKTDNGTNVQIEGLIDVLYPDTIEDHKTSKSTRWLKSKEQLKKNTQVLIYAKVALEELKRKGAPIPPNITVRHNGFIKDPDKPLVRKTEVSIPVAKIDQFWKEHVEENAKKMEFWRQNAEVWSDLPDPKDKGACQAYGGCPYRPICSGRENEEQYEARLDRQGKSARMTPVTVNRSTPKTSKGASVMDLKAELAAKKKAQAAAGGDAAPASVNPPKEENTPKAAASAAAQEPASAPVSELGTTSDGTQLVLPPWVDPDNRVSTNGGIGFNANGAPCKMSDLRAKKAGLPTSDMFEIEADGEGNALWIGKEGTPAEGMEGVSPLSLDAAPVKAEEKVETAPEPSEPETPEEPAQEPEDGDGDSKITSPAKAAASAENGKAGGRPKKSFTLVLNGVAQTAKNEKKGSGRHVYDINALFAEYAPMLVKEGSDDTFFDLNAFDRRDALTKTIAPLIADHVGTDIIQVPSCGNGASDIKAIVDGLLPLAGVVVRGVAG